MPMPTLPSAEVGHRPPALVDLERAVASGTQRRRSWRSAVAARSSSPLSPARSYRRRNSSAGPDEPRSRPAYGCFAAADLADAVLVAEPLGDEIGDLPARVPQAASPVRVGEVREVQADPGQARRAGRGPTDRAAAKRVDADLQHLQRVVAAPEVVEHVGRRRAARRRSRAAFPAPGSCARRTSHSSCSRLAPGAGRVQRVEHAGRAVGEAQAAAASELLRVAREQPVVASGVALARIARRHRVAGCAPAARVRLELAVACWRRGVSSTGCVGATR